jgi:radical SAM protein with 4Fe4S-binding SPASM domain
MNNLAPNLKKLLDENVSNQELIDNTTAYCTMPWVHLHIATSGNVYPCCIADWRQPVGNINDSSFDEIWNGDEMKGFRKNLMADKKDSRCTACYIKEKVGKWSQRIDGINKFHVTAKDWVLNTAEDGQSDNSKPIYWDIRFSNICNMRCRMCGHFSSSRWHADAKAVAEKYNDKSFFADKPKQAIVRGVKDSITLLERLEEYLPYTEEIYFAGGEPLIMEEHYQILRFLDKNKIYDTRIRYSTNLSTLDFKQTNIVDVWKKFSHVECVASLDTFGTRAEILRKDTDWDVIVENAKLIKERAPNVWFRIAPTAQILSIFTAPDLHMDWIEKGLLGPNDCFYNILETPHYHNIRALPPVLKDQVVEKWDDYRQWLIDKFGKKQIQPVLETMANTISYMISEQLPDKFLTQFCQKTKMIDNLRDEDTFAVFPELNYIWNNYNNA